MATEARVAAAYAPQLDGLRAVAVVAVAYSHWLPAWQFGVPFGAGVHLFFVLSGFLITRILLGLRTGPGRGRALGQFYGRRALRLFPAFYLVLAAAWLAAVPLARETWPWHAAYLSNVYIAGAAQWQGHLSHFWSLAVEEQFYLVWPWLVVWSPHRWLGPIFGVAMLAGPAARLAAAAAGLDEPFWALAPGGSADSLAIGALVAWTSSPLALRPGTEDGRARVTAAGAAWPGGALAVAAFGAWGALALAESTGVVVPPAVAVWRQVLQGVVFAWVVRRAADGFDGRAGRVLAHPWTVYLGRISYGVYLVHAFAPLVFEGALRTAGFEAAIPRQPFLRAATSLATTVALAAVMWRLVEVPFLRLKARL